MDQRAHDVATRCRMCNAELEEFQTKLVIVGLADRGADKPPLWIVRPYCTICVESYYHMAIYADG